MTMAIEDLLMSERRHLSSKLDYELTKIHEYMFIQDRDSSDSALKEGNKHVLTTSHNFLHYTKGWATNKL